MLQFKIKSNYRIFFLFSQLPALLIFSCTSSPSINPGDEAFKKKDYTTAIAAYSESLKTNPNDMDLLFGRGRAYQESNRFKEYCQTVELKYRIASCQEAFNLLTLGKKPDDLKKLFGPRIMECFSESDKKRILGI